MKRMIVIAMVVLIVHLSASQAGFGQVLQPGEVLQYKVKWNFLRLGTMILRTELDTSAADSGCYRLILIVKSNPALMFMSLREYNESIINGQDPHSLRYWGKHISGDDSNVINYSYDPAVHRAQCFERDLRTGELKYNTTLDNAPPYVEGASLIFYARCKSHSGKMYGVPTLIGSELHKTRLEFDGGREELSVAAFPQPLRALKYTGFADWKGGSSAGMSGEFTGWVSDDNASVPLRAEVKIILGSITIELEKWNRPGWNPPSLLQTSF